MRPDRAVRRWFRRREYRRLMDEAADALATARHADAEAACSRALAVAEELHGPDDAELVTPLYALSSARLAQGRLDEVAGSCRRAIALAEAAGGAVEPPLPRLLEQLAAIFDHQGKLDEVEALFRKMLAGYERMRDPDPGELAALLNRLGLLLGRQGRRDEAAPLLDRALAPEHPRIAEALYNAATVRGAARAPADAEAMLRRALAIVEGERDERDEHDERAALRASILHNLAVAREEQDAKEEAARLYEQALAAREALVDPDHRELRPTLVRLARLHHAAGRPSAALPLYERALALATAELGPAHPIPAAIEAWIADARSRS